MEYLNIPAGGLHRALADAEACMALFNGCVVEMGGMENTSLQDLLDLNGPPLSLRPQKLELDEPFLPLKSALENGEALEIQYQSAGGTVSVRRITPVSIVRFRDTAMIEGEAGAGMEANIRIRVDQTLAAMKEGKAVIYHGILVSDEALIQRSGLPPVGMPRWSSLMWHTKTTPRKARKRPVWWRELSSS